MADTQEPQYAQDKDTQEMVKQAQENFPNLDKNDAIQQQANMVEGREARTGEGGGATGVVNGIKEKVSGAMESATEAVKQANPATRDKGERQCRLIG